MRMIRYFALSLMLCIAFSCKKKVGEQGAQGPAGANGINYGGKGSVVGIVTFFNNDAQEIATNTNCIVFIPNTSFSANVNAYGGYTITNIPTGVYNLFVKYSGFSSANSVNVSIGTNISYVREMSLVQLPSYTVSYLSSAQSPTNVNLFANLPSGNENKAVEFYISANPNINPYIKSTYQFTRLSGVFNFSGGINMSLTYLYSNGFISGQTVYVKVFPVPGFYPSSTQFNLDMNKFSYTDTITGSYVNTAVYLNGAYATTFVCP